MYSIQRAGSPANQMQMHMSEREVKRTQWMTQGIGAGFKMCSCHSWQKRGEHAQKLLANLCAKFPPNSCAELEVMSIGSGELLQDWILLHEFIDAGYKKIHIHFVDPETALSKADVFRELAIKLFPTVEVAVTLSRTKFEGIGETGSFHSVYAIDFEGLDFADARKPWKTLLKATKALKDNGFVFCTASENEYCFDATSSAWEIPRKFNDVVCEAGAEIRCGLTSIDTFWKTSFYRVAALASMGVSLINMEVVSLPGGEEQERNIRKTQKLVREILSIGSGPMINCNRQSTPEPNAYDILIREDLSIDEAHLSSDISTVKPGGLIILDPHSLWSRIVITTLKDIQEKGRRSKEVYAAIPAIEALAANFSAASGTNIYIAPPPYKL